MLRACPDGWLRTYVYHMRHSESPTQFHFWTGVSTIAGALRRKVWTEHFLYQYTPNFYIILVGPPGVAAKSTSIRQGLFLLKKVKDVHFGPTSLTWQALLDSLKNAETLVKMPGDTVPTPMSCITVGASELGTFMRPENREYIDQLISLYDGQKEDMVRKTLSAGETIIRNPWLNLIACTTPSWLKDVFPDVMVGGGLASRILFVYANKKERLVPYPERLVLGETYKQEEDALVYDLQQIAKITGPYTFSEEAYVWGETWYKNHYNGTRPEHLSSDRFAGYLSRKQAHFHKLAMVLAASKRDERVLEAADLEEAEAHITALEFDMQNVFDSIGVSAGAKTSNEVLSHIRNAKETTYKTLYQACSKTMDGRTFKEAIESALEAGFIQRQPLPNKDWKLIYVGPKN